MSYPASGADDPVAHFKELVKFLLFSEAFSISNIWITTYRMEEDVHLLSIWIPDTCLFA